MTAGIVGGSGCVLNTKYLLIFLILVFVGCAPGTGGGLHVENDLFGSLKTQDKYFTHGTQFNYFVESENEKQTYSIGQTIYTPSTKKPDADPEILKLDRPYTGWLYGEYRNTKFVSDDVKETYGIQLGCSGPCSFARQTQQQAHRYLDQSIPAYTREFALKSEPGVILELERSKLFLQNNFMDIASYVALKTGNIINSAAFGSDIRLGYNLDNFASEPITFKAEKESRSPFMAYVFGRAEERLVLYNHFLDGSLFQDERHTVDSELNVQEADLGFTVGWNKLKFTYRYTLFSSEWKERKGSFAFGGLDFSW